ncbi:MAG: hypothetical protein JXA21_19745 [Anaerolineae bacterium]|nr:hypothetical protein [Anaerolineae bacterium]
MIKNTRTSKSPRLEEALTVFIGVLVLIAAGAGAFIPGFYDGVIDPRYATGNITADIVSLVCVPLLIMCMLLARRGNVIARLSWTSLIAYIGYAYATYAFDRLYTVLFLVYVAIFSMSSFVITSLLAGLDAHRLADRTRDMPLRRVTAVFLMFTGLILYVIELPTILSRIPGGIEAGGTPFMVLDMALIAPISILTGVWLWRRHPWGAALTPIFLIKAITLMSSFLIADYIDWFAGRLKTQGATIAFTIVYLFVYFFAWNYFAAFGKKQNSPNSERANGALSLDNPPLSVTINTDRSLN